MMNAALFAGFRRFVEAGGVRTTPSIRQSVPEPDYEGNDGTTKSVTLTVLAGSTIVVFTTSNAAGGGAITITDSQSGTYAELHEVISGENTEEAVHVRENVSAGSLTVTQTFANSRSYRGLVVVEVQDCDPDSLIGSSFVLSNPGTSGSNSISTGNVTVDADDVNALLLGFVMNDYGNDPSTPATGTASTLYDSYLLYSGQDQAIVTTREITAAGSYAGVFSPVSNSDYHTGFAVLLRGSP